jgi:phytoene dehydrogenase-like protein
VSNAFDIVVVGGGSNSLSAAAYLAKAGKSVVVLEKNASCGGGAISREIAPGFIHDPHATGLMTCMVSPTLAKDELELRSRFGLKFVEWDAAFTTLFDDGSVLATYQSLNRTCQSIAKLSAHDANRYRELGLRCVKFGPLLNAGAATPPYLLTGS